MPDLAGRTTLGAALEGHLLLACGESKHTPVGGMRSSLLETRHAVVSCGAQGCRFRVAAWYERSAGGRREHARL